ncbi:MAG: prepilin peptidase [Cyanobacteria bacterium P01_A01_bin.84]
MIKVFEEILIAVPAILLVFAIGISIGSFINVVVYRLPAGLSVLYPPSRCPRCFNKLKAYDNVPVFGWLWLRGRCRYCKTKIAARYPIVEGITGLLFLLVFVVFQFSFSTIGYWVFCSWLLALALIDLDTMTLPNALTKSGLILGILFQAGLGWMIVGSVSAIANYLMGGIFAAVLGLWLFDAIALLSSIALGKTAMGAGDAKLAAMMGSWLGWKYLLLASFMGCVFGAVFGGIIIFLSRHKWGQKMPFGPFLALGSMVTLLCGSQILSSYMQLFVSTP